MGREIKRVPLDFAWPRGKKWDGFVNPFYRPCPEDGRACFNGYNASGAWLEALCRFVDLVCADALRGKCHPYMDGFPNPPTRKDRTIVPAGAEFVRVFERLTRAKASGDFFSGDRLAWPLMKRLLKGAGMKSGEFGRCETCQGECLDPAVKVQYDAWKETPVPTGEGWQVWETVSEGSPISPVFATAEALAQHLSSVGDDWKRPGDPLPSYAQAMALIRDESAMSLVIVNGQVLGPYEQAAALKPSKES